MEHADQHHSETPDLHEVPPDSRFSYFLLQTQVATGKEETAALVRLTVEDLSSGEKLVFNSIPDFSRFLKRLTGPGDERWAPPADAR